MDLGPGDAGAASVRAAADLIRRQVDLGSRISRRRSASSRAVPLGASGLVDLA